MSKRVWKKGPPPHVGWWNASRGRYEECWRWWDGKRWSWSAWSDETAEEAASHARFSATPDDIKWTDYWPENARVPRVDPRIALKITKNRAYGKFGVPA